MAVTDGMDIFPLYCYMGLRETKTVFRVSAKARLKPVSLATETCYKNEISLVARLEFDNDPFQRTNDKSADQSVLQLGWSAPLLFTHSKDRFSRIKVYM